MKQNEPAEATWKEADRTGYAPPRYAAKATAQQQQILNQREFFGRDEPCVAYCSFLNLGYNGQAHQEGRHRRKVRYSLWSLPA
ncbi:hypothetical protein Q1695_009856 [Nippostrongylus brasiliensis]|nr:hypothetical protein Q1695_009856 [Nippostrongylus brasiliensis]